jgi:hypothetical protein
MSARSDSILASLKAVDAERRHRSEAADLDAKVAALKTFQQRRFSRTYADLLLTDRYGPAVRFFLEELYGPNDFTRRDAQFARVVSGLVRLFPQEVVDTVASVAELHALSEELDTAMATRLAHPDIVAADYVRAWQEVGRAADRQRQVSLTLDVANRLDRFTRIPMLRRSLHLMRAPARAVRVAELQRFLEMGFDTFRAMNGALEFVAIVRAREQAFADVLFATDAADLGRGSPAAGALAALS